MISGKEAGNQRADLAEILDDHADRKREQRRNNRRFYGRFLLLDVIALFAGMILQFFCKSLGFGGFLFGAILLLLGFSFAQITEKL